MLTLWWCTNSIYWAVNLCLTGLKSIPRIVHKIHTLRTVDFEKNCTQILRKDDNVRGIWKIIVSFAISKMARGHLCGQKPNTYTPSNNTHTRQTRVPPKITPLALICCLPTHLASDCPCVGGLGPSVYLGTTAWWTSWKPSWWTGHDISHSEHPPISRTRLISSLFPPLCS